MRVCTLHLAITLGIRLFSREITKKYASYCIIACVLTWQRRKDSNPQRLRRCAARLKFFVRFRIPGYDKKRASAIAEALWQRRKDSNPHKRSQSPVCYLYTTPLNARIIIHSFSDLSTHFFTRFRCFRNTLPPAPHNSLQAGPRTPRSFSAQAPGRSFEESPRTRRWKPSARGF